MKTNERDSYRAEYAATAGQQAAFFREQAERHRQQAEQARVFAELSPGEESLEQSRRAERLALSAGVMVADWPARRYLAPLLPILRATGGAATALPCVVIEGIGPSAAFREPAAS